MQQWLLKYLLDGALNSEFENLILCDILQKRKQRMENLIFY